MNLIAIGSCMGAPKYFAEFFEYISVVTKVEQAQSVLTKDSVIMYGGGEDISPALYNARHYLHGQKSLQLSYRDKLERDIYNLGVEVGAAHYGICRGAQMLAALSGGRLFQHVNSHAGRSHATYVTKEVVETLPKFYESVKPLFAFEDDHMLVTSAHHQAVDIEHLKTVTEVISVLENPPKSDKYVVDDRTVLGYNKVRADCEAFYIPKTRVFGVQGHPEFDSMDSTFVKFCQKMMKYLIEDNHASDH